mgnify:CR=1 FL=1
MSGRDSKKGRNGKKERKSKKPANKTTPSLTQDNSREASDGGESRLDR